MSTAVAPRPGTRQMLNKVPEVTIWFWIIKILCTTVGESFADWINMTLGVGLDATAAISTVVLVGVGVVQFRLDRYVPAVYWLAVVVVSTTGTLYTDILTDERGVPLKLSSAVMSVVLALVFALWYYRERTLSIHSIVTLPREAFYWLAVLVTFALGTAAGDWTLELTGWSPGKSVLLPASLIAIVTAGWKLGAGPVLAFWLAYILTRPLGANIGDWLATPRADQGVGLGVGGASVLFLAVIAATVAYLSVTKADVIPADRAAEHSAKDPLGPRQQAILGAWALVAVGTGFVLHHASQQPHTSALAEEEGTSSSASDVQLPPGQAVIRFPAADVAQFKTITADTLALVGAGKQAEAAARITDLETAWDDAQGRLEPADSDGWTYVDDRIDTALTAVRGKKPDPAAEKDALDELLTAMTPQSGGQGDPAAAGTASPAASSAAPSAPPSSSAQAARPSAAFPAADVEGFRKIARDTLDLVGAGKQTEAAKRITDLETAWDDAQARLAPMDRAAWTAIDDKIDAALKEIRAGRPDSKQERAALEDLLRVLA